jgi:hypothetical protein
LEKSQSNQGTRLRRRLGGVLGGRRRGLITILEDSILNVHLVLLQVEGLALFQQKKKNHSSV